MKTKPLVLLTLALLPSFFTPANADLKDGLVAHWSFDDCTAKDNSGNGHDGTLNGNLPCVDGVTGKAFSFDGNFQSILVQDKSDLNFETRNFSISSWIKSNQTGIWKRILTKRGDSYNWYSLALWEGKVRFEIYGGGNLTSSKDINDGKWHLVTVSRDSATGLVAMYVDGIFDASIQDVRRNLNTSENTPLEIGTWGNESYDSGTLTGLLDELLIYNRALSESEITELYKNPTEIFKPSYTLSQPLDSIFTATDGSEQMDGTVFGQCVYGGYCARPTQKGALNGVNYMVDSGTPVYAICDGVVKSVTKGGDIKTRYTAIDHSNCGDVKGGLFAYYRHIDPAQNIKKGARIKAGDLIGTVATWKNNSHLQLSLATKFLNNLTGYTELKTITNADCSKTTVEQRRKTLNDTGWLDPIEIGMKSGWNSVLLKGGIAKTGCNATEQLYETAPLGNTLPYSPWK